MAKKTKKVKIDFRIVIAGLVCLTLIEMCALFNGVDGKLLTTVIGIICLAIGIVLPSPLQK